MEDGDGSTSETAAVAGGEGKRIFFFFSLSPVLAVFGNRRPEPGRSMVEEYLEVALGLRTTRRKSAVKQGRFRVAGWK